MQVLVCTFAVHPATSLKLLGSIRGKYVLASQSIVLHETTKREDTNYILDNLVSRLYCYTADPTLRRSSPEVTSTAVVTILLLILQYSVI